MISPLCLRCGHPIDWHRNEDDDGVRPCVGYNYTHFSENDYPDPPCDCCDFIEAKK